MPLLGRYNFPPRLRSDAKRQAVGPLARTEWSKAKANQRPVVVRPRARVAVEPELDRIAALEAELQAAAWQLPADLVADLEAERALDRPSGAVPAVDPPAPPQPQPQPQPETPSPPQTTATAKRDRHPELALEDPSVGVGGVAARPYEPAAADPHAFACMAGGLAEINTTAVDTAAATREIKTAASARRQARQQQQQQARQQTAQARVPAPQITAGPGPGPRPTTEVPRADVDAVAELSSALQEEFALRRQLVESDSEVANADVASRFADARRRAAAMLKRVLRSNYADVDAVVALRPGDLGEDDDDDDDDDLAQSSVMTTASTRRRRARRKHGRKRLKTRKQRMRRLRRRRKAIKQGQKTATKSVRARVKKRRAGTGTGVGLTGRVLPGGASPASSGDEGITGRVLPGGASPASSGDERGGLPSGLYSAYASDEAPTPRQAPDMFESDVSDF